MRLLYPKSPACRFHVLLVPKRHIMLFDGLTDEEILQGHRLIRQLVAKAKAELPGFAGYNLVSNNGGPAVRQHVPHCHMHVFLRLAGETADPFAPRDSAVPPELTDEQRTDMQVLQALFQE